MQTRNKEFPKDTIDAISVVIEQYRKMCKTNSHDSVELELRFGTQNSRGKFTPGRTRDFLDNALNLVQGSSVMQQSDWCEHHDYFYNALNGDEVRTRIIFDTDNLELERKTIQKQRVADIMLIDGDDMVRISLSKEETYTKDLPVVVNTSHVRIQQRRCFTYGEPNGPPNWCYDFSITWFGATKTAAELQQQNSEPKFEMEVELVNPSYLARHANAYISNSILLKACDFMGGHRDFRVHG